MSQSDVAKAMCVSQVTISYWEKGIVYPSIPTIYKLARILQAQPTDIFNSFKVDEKEF